MELEFASPEDDGTPFDAPLSLVEDIADTGAGAAFEAAERLLKRVSPGTESVCFSEVVTLLEVASLFALALSVTAGLGDIGAVFEVTERLLKRVSPGTESAFLSEAVPLLGITLSVAVDV